MKATASILLCLLVSAGTFADEFKTITTEHTRLDIPAGWHVRQPVPVGLYDLMSGDYTVSGNLLQEQIAAAQTFDEYYDNSLEDIKNLMSDVEIVEKQANSGCPATSAKEN